MSSIRVVRLSPRMTPILRFVVRRRWPVAAVTGLVISGAGAYALRVPIDYGMEQFFPAFGEERATYDEFRSHFFKEDTQFALLWEDDREPGVALFDDLAEVADAFERVGLEEVRWFGNVEVTEEVVEGGEVATRMYRLSERSDLSDEVVREMLARNRDDELLRGLYWNTEQTVFAVHGFIPPERNTDRGRRETEGKLTESLSAISGGAAATRLVGLPVFRSRIPKMLERDQILFLGGGFVVLFAVLFSFFRDVRHVLFCLVSVLPAYVLTVSLIGLTGRSVSILTSFIPIVVLVVGGSDAIHLLVRYRRERAVVDDHREAIVRSFSELAAACFYTSITTAIGFFSLVGTRIAMIMEFGVFTALAILLTYAFSMTVLPALLALSPGAADDRGLTPRWIAATIRAAVRAPMRRGATVAAFVAFAVVGLALGARLEVHSWLLNDMRRDSDVVGDMRWAEDRGFGVWQVNLLIRADGAGELHDPRMLAWMDDVLVFARDAPVVLDATGLPDVMRELGRGIGQDGEALPESTEAAAQLLFLAELSETPVDDVYVRDAGVAQLVLTVRDEGARVVRPLLADIDRFVADHPAPFGTVATTGTAQMKLAYSARLVATFGPTLALALALVLGVMVQMFGSVRMALLALLPNLVPLVAILATMKIAGVAVKPSTIMVFSIAFGLAVDDTMHLLDRVRERLGGGDTLSSAMERALVETGPTILMTTLAMSAGFLLLTGSQFEILVLVGVMTAVSAATAAVADLFLLPALMSFIKDRGCRPGRRCAR